MKTSRRDGILVLNTKKPYKIAINGKLADKTLIICRDVTFETEGFAFDLEQSLTRALVEMSQSFNKENIKQKLLMAGSEEQIKKDEQNKAFFNNESPTEEEIEEMCSSLLMPILMSKNVSLRETMAIFNELALSGAIECHGNIPMSESIWRTVSRKDRLEIAFSYISFFANPLSQLLGMTTGKGENELLEATKE